MPSISRAHVAILERIARSAFLAASALCVLALPAAAQSYTVLHSFRDVQQDPNGLIQASDGNYYGTTSLGGAMNLGSVFRVTPAGTLTTLYSFVGVDGQNPRASLVQGTDGNFYGTTSSGGASLYYGTVFKITPAGALTTLHAFSGSGGGGSHAPLVQGTDGDFYGTTSASGSMAGTIFKITPAGALTTLHALSGSDGSNPSSLVQGTDGDFYGTTGYGGSIYGGGTVFKITPAGGVFSPFLSPRRLSKRA